MGGMARQEHPVIEFKDPRKYLFITKSREAQQKPLYRHLVLHIGWLNTEKSRDIHLRPSSFISPQTPSFIPFIRLGMFGIRLDSLVRIMVG